MMIKKKRVWLVATVFVMAAAAGCLTGCGSPHRGKVELPDHTERSDMAGEMAAGEDSGLEMPEIVIDLEPYASKTMQKDGTEQRDGAEPEQNSEEPKKKPASEYEAGQVMSSEEIAELGVDAFFYQTAIGKKLYRRMEGKSYKKGCPVAVEDLRYLRVLHYGYQGEIRVGELVCNQSVSEDLLVIFRKLYDARYPIEKIRLIDDYGGDDDSSSADNNTSCFNYRNVAGKESLSLHALGIAIDINPVCNPYVVTDEEGNVTCAPANGSSYADRSKSFPHKIDEEDLCCRFFTEAGFTWGGSWEEEPDYMHFSRGSTPET